MADLLIEVQLSDPQRGLGAPSHLNAEVGSRADGSEYTPARAAKLDNLDVPVSSVDTGVWTHPQRT